MLCYIQEVIIINHIIIRNKELSHTAALCLTLVEAVEPVLITSTSTPIELFAPFSDRVIEITSNTSGALSSISW